MWAPKYTCVIIYGYVIKDNAKTVRLSVTYAIYNVVKFYVMGGTLVNLTK